MPDPIPCGACEQPAAVRYALAGPSERPLRALGARAQYRCALHFPATSPMWLAHLSPRYLVIDPAFSAVAIGPLCDCGMPLAEHSGATRRACARAAAR